MRFYLGTHMPQWLEKATVPLFVSRARLYGRVSRYPRATHRWALDSGGFTEITKHGGWRIDAKKYVAEVRRFRDEIGSLDWAAPQDWMCEPIATKATGLSIAEHIRRTVNNFIDLKCLDPDLPFIPVIQGFQLDDYRRCLDRYTRAGIDLTRHKTVGIGSVCRRQATAEAASIVHGCLSHVPGMKLHGFGFKIQGLKLVGDALYSADSLAWSLDARRLQRPLEGCTGHKNCANCLRYALRWREKITHD